MTREEAKQWLPIIKAYADGKTIQVIGALEWSDHPDPMFTSSPKHYRIKPEPREIYVCVSCHEITGERESRPGHEVCKFREVIE